MKKRFFVLLIILVILVFILILVYFSSKLGGGSSSFPTPTPAGSISFPEDFNTASPEDIKKAKESYLVGQLIPALPHHGTNFSLYYDFSKNQFILYLNPFATSEGSVEFDAFLKQNGVEDRSWIENLTSTNQQITPAP